MNNDYELDYKLMFESLSNRIEKLLKQDDEYFSLIQMFDDYHPYITAIGRTMLKLQKTDQINVLRVLSCYGELCKKLCAKYDLLDE